MDINGLTELKDALDNGTAMNIMEYINKNNIDERPMQVRRQLINEFGKENMRSVFRKMRQRMSVASGLPLRIDAMTSRFVEIEGVTIEDCDSMIASLNNAISTVQGKKDSLSV